MSTLSLSKKKPNKSSFFVITRKDEGKVFEIDSKGAVYWLVGSEFRQAKTDQQLGKALGKALNTIVKMNIELGRVKGKIK